MQVRELLTYTEAAEYLNIPLSSAYSLVFRKILPHIRLSPRVVRFERAALDAWLDERTVATEERARGRNVPR